MKAASAGGGDKGGEKGGSSSNSLHSGLKDACHNMYLQISLKSDYESSVKKLTVLVSKKGKKNNKLAELLSTLSIYSVDPSLLDSLLAGILLSFYILPF